MGCIFSAIVIDDDPSARNILEKFLESDGRVKVLNGLDSAVHAIEVIEKFSPDAIFLDINMPQEDGLQFASRLKKNQINSLLIFCTAFRNYAMEAFELRPFDFLVKPFGINEVLLLIDKIVKELSYRIDHSNELWSAQNCGKYKFKTNSGYIFLEPFEIFCFKCIGNGSELITNMGSVIKIHRTISDLSDYLDCPRFIKVNKSSIINTDYLVSVDKRNKTCKIKSNNLENEFFLTAKSMSDLDDHLLLKLA